MTDDLTTRLQRSMSEVSLTDEVKAAHLGAISEALQGAPIVSLDPVSRRRRIIAAVTAAALIGPTGLAAASGDALPGEPLYGVKQVSEQVTSLFDSEVIARHRIEEAEALAMLGRDSNDAISSAADAVVDLPEDHALRHRLAALAEDAEDEDSEQDPEPGRVVQPTPGADDDDSIDDGGGRDIDDESAESDDRADTDDDDITEDDTTIDDDTDVDDDDHLSDDDDDISDDAEQTGDSDDVDDDSDDDTEDD